MAKLRTFLTYQTQAEEAVKHYTSIFKSSKIVRTSRYGAGMPMPEGSVMTIEFELLGQPYVALNGGPPFEFSDGVSITVDVETQAEIDEITEKLIAGGGEQRPCGWLTDRFGMRWQVTPIELHDMLYAKDRAAVDRTMQAMMTMTKLDLATLKKAFNG
jgi:predicted 3-demethylubiquinone-9 3-methyltransferase (glyoxalase superfamily)